jgi:hypothetical protein
LFGGLYGEISAPWRLGSGRLVGRFSGLVAAKNVAAVVWLQPRNCFCLPFTFGGDVTSDEQHKKEHNSEFRQSKAVIKVQTPS